MLYSFVERIQVKFPWEIQALGQEQEVVRVTWGHRVPWRDQRKSRALSLTRKTPLKVRVTHSPSETFSHDLFLEGAFWKTSRPAQL